MLIQLPRGHQHLEVNIPDARLIATLAGPDPLADPAAALSEALEHPFGYPALRRALTPEDRIVVLLDESLPGVGALLVALLDHIGSAGVSSENVTIVCPTTSAQPWIEDLPERHEGVHVEVHDPNNRQRLSYLATTTGGRRLYLNRSAVDADQLIVLTGRRYDLALGYAGAEGAIFPGVADEQAQAQAATTVRTGVPGGDVWPLRQEAIEVSWLMGQPFFVQVIASRGEGVARVVAGAADACREGERLLDAGWKKHLPRRADLALVTLSGDRATHTFADLAAAVACAARVVAPQGRIVLVADAAPPLGPGGEVLLRADEPRLAAAALEKAIIADSGPAQLWAQSAAYARLSVLGAWSDETTEELFATPLASAAEIQRLIDAGGDCVVMRDAQGMMALVG